MINSRVRYEKELQHDLEKGGYKVIRSAGSRGPFDLFAFSSTEVRLIQVKSTKNLKRPGNVSTFADAIALMLEVTVPDEHCSRWLYVRALRSKWFSACIDGYPIERSDLKDQVRKLVERWLDVKEL